MTNALTLKTFAWNENKRMFYSPSKSSFAWTTDIVYSNCDKCYKDGTIGLNCTCGLYGSPNWECLEEYHNYPNSVIALMNTYGRHDVWTGPPDLKWHYVTRSVGMQVIGIINPGKILIDSANKAQRFSSAILAAEKFNVEIFQLGLAKEMITHTWRAKIGFDPYKLNRFIIDSNDCQWCWDGRRIYLMAAEIEMYSQECEMDEINQNGYGAYTYQRALEILEEGYGIKG